MNENLAKDKRKIQNKMAKRERENRLAAAINGIKMSAADMFI